MKIRWTGALLVFVFCGCTTLPESYKPPEHHYIANQLDPGEDYVQIERGRDFWPFDALNHYLLSLPVKILLWDWQLLDHKMSDEDEALLEYYLEFNQLRSVKIRHNQWDPIGEARRLGSNHEVGWPYRYTLGALLWLRYALIPDRIFAGVPLIGGGDHFNPFTNTINVYSSDISVLLHEAGHAKDYMQRDSKGTMALLRLVPVVDLIEEATASSDAIRFLHCFKFHEREFNAYPTLIPAYSTYIAGYFPGGLIVTAPVVLTAHVTSRFQRRSQRHSHRQPELDVNEYSRDDFLPPWCQSVDLKLDELPDRP